MTRTYFEGDFGLQQLRVEATHNTATIMRTSRNEERTLLCAEAIVLDEEQARAVLDALQAFLADANRSPEPTEIPDHVMLSNSGCRLRYAGGERQCKCPEGTCWFDDQHRRRDAGQSALSYAAWRAELAEADKFLDPSLTSEGDVDQAIRAAGGDPETIKRDGETFVRDLLSYEAPPEEGTCPPIKVHKSAIDLVARMLEKERNDPQQDEKARRLRDAVKTERLRLDALANVERGPTDRSHVVASPEEFAREYIDMVERMNKKEHDEASPARKANLVKLRGLMKNISEEAEGNMVPWPILPDDAPDTLPPCKKCMSKPVAMWGRDYCADCYDEAAGVPPHALTRRDDESDEGDW